MMLWPYEWIEIFAQLELDGMLRKQSVSHLSLEAKEGGNWVFIVMPRALNICEKHRSQLELLLNQYLGSPVKVEVKDSANKRESPAQRA
jgi:hypothetical protein